MHAASEAIQTKGYEAADIMKPGLNYGATFTKQLDFISLGLSLVLGTAGLPHVLMRFYTVPTAKEARKSVTWAIVLIGAFYLMTLVLGYGAAALVGPDRILDAPGGANAAAPLLALELGGSIFMALISAVAFATVLAVVAGLAITASASVAHDVYDAVFRDGKSSEEEQVRVSRITVVVLGIIAIILGILAMQQNVAFLVSLALRHRGLREPADDPVLAVLEALQHRRCRRLHVHRCHLRPDPDLPVPGRLRCPHRDVPERRLVDLPAHQPGSGLHPAGASSPASSPPWPPSRTTSIISPLRWRSAR
ncbi:hypothetical protein QP028_03465 [Corynebacterium suedekumii]|nr:hypothetical protein QP028_03465 [Corynebacterium suedekumii]